MLAITDAARNKKGEGLNFFVMIKAYYANCSKLQGLAKTRRSPAVVHAADA